MDTRSGLILAATIAGHFLLWGLAWLLGLSFANLLDHSLQRGGVLALAIVEVLVGAAVLGGVIFGWFYLCAQWDFFAEFKSGQYLLIGGWALWALMAWTIFNNGEKRRRPSHDTFMDDDEDDRLTRPGRGR